MAPRNMIRDRDRLHGIVVTRRLRAMASGTGLAHQLRLDRMALPNGWSDRSGMSVWPTSLSRANASAPVSEILCQLSDGAPFRIK
jgi:hypothetical protein